VDVHPLIYAHRGIWQTRDQQNSRQSIEAARFSGYGVETDFRSKSDSLVISHDPYGDSKPLAADEIDFTEIPVALNIKEDGLLPQYEAFIEEYPNQHTFLFDGSIPEMVKIKERKLPHALRLSEYETDLPWESQFLWIDGFNSDWWIKAPKILNLMEKHFAVFVSPELHGRDLNLAWEFFHLLHSKVIAPFGICTDQPDKLKAVFNE
jgi:glycerophosphoryl diester phosphodiesterase